ncbi:MAG TPA: SEC-C metal-binding domain-containing protein, partial [Solirubrobacteraceae bacterium]|nr:SEC-C metal-binding domain-containing protein [Solirubrobacteraceae bacterium]
LKRAGIIHTVLNAKYHQQEAEIVTRAGLRGAVTIATNMAGRGTDIKLGGNLEAELAALPPETDAATVSRLRAEWQTRHDAAVAAGGLHIVGTERHESRRIDNQLRGRSGRQGDQGESRFFLSAEDDLVRLFAGDRIYRILDKLGGVDEEGNEEPIEAGMLSKQIEKAQRKVEEQNFLIRKRVLEYDDVMNEQRRVIYAYRDQVLEGDAMGEQARTEIGHVIERTIEEYTQGDYLEDWDLDGLFNALSQFFPIELGPGDINPEALDRTHLGERVLTAAMERYDAREQELGEELMGQLERYLLLQTIDDRWREHLYDMDYLREGIGLRGIAQLDPLIAYKNEAYDLFGDLVNTIWADYARMIFNVQVVVEGPNGGGAPPAPAFAAAGNATRPGRVSYSGGSAPMGAGAIAAAAAAAGPAGVAQAAYAENGEDGELAMPVVEQRVLDTEHQVGRNDPCWCGSGKKFKRCHGA